MSSRAAGQVKSTADTIHTQLQDLNARVLEAVSHWDGETRQAFHERHRNWDNNVDHMHNTLLDIAKAMKQAAHDYKANDKAQAGRF
ncbi:WXG100 family type VII secretion target [Streptomyces cinnamoneus]|uniref:WXG100 family type VII secretion target n=1 Tax=Streptomyces cinnamoneus TaxID=53446 RepID=UPI001EFEDD25|nr:WXG100 family type VII secretion target [Streptomyces cinnamoneus]